MTSTTTIATTETETESTELSTSLTEDSISTFTTIIPTPETTQVIVVTAAQAGAEPNPVIIQEITREVVTETPTTAIKYICYKPSTHYVHYSTCRWFDDTCYEITDTLNLEARKCSECNPDIEIVNLYVPTPEVATSIGVSDYDRQLLAEIVCHEAGSDWISTYNKAKVAAGVMNRVNDSRFPSTVYGVLTQPNQFSGYWPGCCTPYQSCYDAVDYYLTHTNEFNTDNSWWGDGYQNHFYYQ